MTACKIMRSPFDLPAWFAIVVIVLCLGANVGVLKAATETLQITETDACLTVKYGDKIVLVYNKQSPPVPKGIDPVYQRSGFLHPVNTPNGKTITETFPKDHPHQHGIFSAWVNTSYGDRSIDFWNLAGRTGRVVHERVVRLFQDDGTVGFEVDLLHRAEEPVVDILRERWKVTVYEPVADYYCFDLESIQDAVTDTPLVINQYHYGGMALRGISRWLSMTDKESDRSDELKREPSSFLNSSGQDRKIGNHSPTTWVALTGMIDQQSVCIAVLSHPKNFRAPQPARLHGTKPYFCFSPCVTSSFEISREQPLHAKYRYLITDASPDSDWIDSQWRKMADSTVPDIIGIK